MSKYWSARLRGLVPYTPGEQPREKLIKLNTNENPYPPSPKAVAALGAAGPELRLYPDPECRGLTAALAGHYGLAESQVFIGNGSDEILAFSFLAFFNPGRPILFADITYSFYPVYGAFFGIDYETVPLDGAFNLPVEPFCKAGGGGVLLASPNAPTGKAVGLDGIEKIVGTDENRVVIVDEAYVDFGGVSAVPLISKYPNLLVIQTMSKSRALAGLRVGYAMGNENLIQALGLVKNSINPYTVDYGAQSAAEAAVKDAAYYTGICGRIVATRERTAARLRGMDFTVLDSKANFLFIRHEQVAAKTLLRGLREKGILVRHFDKERIRNFLRVTIGTDDEMEIFCGAVESLL